MDEKIFCNKNYDGRKVLEGFVKSLKDDFEKIDNPAPSSEQKKIPRGQLAAVLHEHYEVWGLDELIKSSHRLKASEDKRSWVADLPSKASIVDQPGVTTISSNLWAMAAEQGWSTEERRCAMRLARKRSGTADKIFPGQDFSECLRPGNSLSSRQEYAIDVAAEKVGILSLPAAGGTYGPPIPASNYRGWYYCYTTTSLCTGKQRIMWAQKESLFGARGGKHGGVDIFDADGKDEINNIYAVASGKLIYNNLDPGEWGHALILPFKKDNKDYYAVYAHLPPTAKAMDGKSVKTGDPIGLAGCSGNAGDTKGNCNNYCVVNGAGRSDIHLHFETIEIETDKTKKKVDPTAVIDGFKPDKNSDIRIYTCDKTNQTVAAK